MDLDSARFAAGLPLDDIEPRRLLELHIEHDLPPRFGYQYLPLLLSAIGVAYLIHNLPRTTAASAAHEPILPGGSAIVVLGLALLGLNLWLLQTGTQLRYELFFQQMLNLGLSFELERPVPAPRVGSNWMFWLLQFPDSSIGRRRSIRQWPQRSRLLDQYYAACLERRAALTSPGADFYDSLSLLPTLVFTALIVGLLGTPHFQHSAFANLANPLFAAAVCLGFSFSVPGMHRYFAFNRALREYLIRFPERFLVQGRPLAEPQ